MGPNNAIPHGHWSSRGVPGRCVLPPVMTGTWLLQVHWATELAPSLAGCNDHLGALLSRAGPDPSMAV